FRGLEDRSRIHIGATPPPPSESRIRRSCSGLGANGKSKRSGEHRQRRNRPLAIPSVSLAPAHGSPLAVPKVRSYFLRGHESTRSDRTRFPRPFDQRGPPPAGETRARCPGPSRGS